MHTVQVRRHVLETDTSFPDVLDGIYTGISRPDIGRLFDELAACTSYEELSSLVRQAEGSAGLMPVDLQPGPRDQAREQVGVARQDHRVAVAVGDKHRHLDAAQPLEHRVVRDALGGLAVTPGTN